jgi:transcriptional regulator with XRE-family HTH domain
LKAVRRKNVVGPRIRQARGFHEPPLSQEDLARCITKRGVNMDQGTVSRIENQMRTLSDYEMIAFAKCLKITVSWLCGENSRQTFVPQDTHKTPRLV